MLTALAVLLVAVWLVALAFISFLCVECVAALWPATSRAEAGEQADRRLDRAIVLIPAHNEALTLPRCLASLAADGVAASAIVVAANDCDDETADVARRAGVTVFEHRTGALRLKASGLTAALHAIAMEHLNGRADQPPEGQTPEVVVFVDADSWVRPGAVPALVRTALETGRPAQAVFLQRSPSPGSLARLSTYAFAVRNLVRPLGLHRLGLPCLLHGSGMAVPWKSIRDGFDCEDDEPEDYRLAIALALRGAPPIFCPAAWVESFMPAEAGAAAKQRRAWIARHVRVAARHAPALMRAAVRKRAWWMAALTMELIVPPMSVLVPVMLVALAASAVLAVRGHVAPLVLGVAAFVVLGGALAAARLSCPPAGGRHR